MSDYYLFRTALLDLLRTRKLVSAAILIAMPAILGLLVKWKSDPDTYLPESQYGLLTVFFIFGFVLIMLSVIFSTGVVAQEVEQKTIVYLLTRPVPRWRILLMKYLAAVLVTTVVGWLAIVAAALTTYGPLKLGGTALGRDLAILPVGVMAYSAIFLLIATLLNRPLIFGLIFAFGWETLMRILPGYGQYCSVMTYLRVLAPHDVPGSMLGQLAQSVSGVEPPTMPVAWIVMICITIVALLAAFMTFSIREYVPREDAG